MGSRRLVRTWWHSRRWMEQTIRQQYDLICQLEAAGEQLPCPHGRSTWRMCPHCLGLNAPFPIIPPGALQQAQDFGNQQTYDLGSNINPPRVVP